MKKFTLFVCAFLMLASSANAEDWAINRMRDNWFIEAMGGAGVMMSRFDAKANFGERIGWKANLAVGKWFSPLFGVRIGGEMNQMKGAITRDGMLNGGYIGAYTNKTVGDGAAFKQLFNNLGIFGDGMFNLTNWICGYRYDRVYNATVYAGASIHWVFEREGSDGTGKWHYGGKDEGRVVARNLSLRAGLLNTFRLSKHFNLLLDLRFDMLQEQTDGYEPKTWIEYPSVLLGFSYKFNETNFHEAAGGVIEKEVVKTVTVVDEEGLRNLRNKLAQANAKISDLEAQLDECLKKKPVDNGNDINEISDEAPLATIYYPIGKSYITKEQQAVVDAVAEVMKNEDNNYILTGWADNYTGTDAINIKLRHDRVNGVKKSLEGKGIASDRLSAETNNGELTNYGPACAALDRAVTIQRAK